jgi:hypothetical protein
VDAPQCGNAMARPLVLKRITMQQVVGAPGSTSNTKPAQQHRLFRLDRQLRKYAHAKLWEDALPTQT